MAVAVAVLVPDFALARMSGKAFSATTAGSANIRHSEDRITCFGSKIAIESGIRPR